MKIGDKFFNEAVEIITNSPSEVTVSFNVPVNDNYCNVYPIIIRHACPALIEKLISRGYMVGVNSKGVHVDRV